MKYNGTFEEDEIIKNNAEELVNVNIIGKNGPLLNGHLKIICDIIDSKKDVYGILKEYGLPVTTPNIFTAVASRNPDEATINKLAKIDNKNVGGVNQDLLNGLKSIPEYNEIIDFYLDEVIAWDINLTKK
ncbi:hypothetical protein HNP86_001576 [Methanococcus maripaludis]|uniref:Uncharacterized protein n=1 Tax=Methanococcus maripaludis TaxID=39152 RepID=A0A7J9NWN0_METMI|nr:hypothetical protein [Methanococcus maripaludis]MBA2851423.1 hypothetical protein [Methanococcus maripaludis]